MEFSNLISNNGNYIKGPLIIKPEILEDERGFFFESWNQKTFNNGIKESINFTQDNHSFSNLVVIRGLHYQIEP